MAHCLAVGCCKINLASSHCTPFCQLSCEPRHKKTGLQGLRPGATQINLYSHRIKIELRSVKSSEHINEKGDGPYCGFGYLSLFSDPIDLVTWSQRELL